MKQFYQSTILFALSLISFPDAASSQTISYGYDLAGNRIKREIVLSTYGDNSRKVVPKSSFAESLSDKTIKIYPNPTKGMLKVEIGGWTDTDNGSLTFFNSNGVCLISKPLVEPYETLNITEFSPGIYFMKIKIHDNETTWKIIKE